MKKIYPLPKMELSLDYDTFVEIMKNLPVEDIVSACATNRSWRSFCQQPNFWSDVIFRSYHQTFPNATAEDYSFFYNLQQIIPLATENLPREQQLLEQKIAKGKVNRRAPRTTAGRRPVPYTAEEITAMRAEVIAANQVLFQIIAELQRLEIEGRIAGLPVQYWVPNPEEVGEGHYLHSVRNTFARAHTPAGAILRLTTEARDLELLTSHIENRDESETIEELTEALIGSATGEFGDPTQIISFEEIIIDVI